MLSLVTGATGFVGAHVTRALVERGDSVRAGYRNPKRLDRLGDLDVEPVEGEILDLDAMRKAMRGCDTVFHVAGFVASKPVGKVWELNQRGPLVAVEAAAMEDVRRVVLTSTISAVGTADGRPADEENPYPEDGPRPRLRRLQARRRARGDRRRRAPRRRGRRRQPRLRARRARRHAPSRARPRRGSSATTCAAGCPPCSTPRSTSSTSRTSPTGHLLAAERGRPGERYILGGHNRRGRT